MSLDDHVMEEWRMECISHGLDESVEDSCWQKREETAG
jgi:hypothetical protein